MIFLYLGKRVVLEWLRSQACSGPPLEAERRGRASEGREGGRISPMLHQEQGIEDFGARNRVKGPHEDVSFGGES